jgi:hypothetical protein
MSLSRVVLFVVGTLSGSAWADTVPDPKVWAQQFAAIASHGDKDALFAALSPVFDPKVNRAQLQSVLETIERGLEGRKAKSSSIIREEGLGDAVYRFNRRFITVALTTCFIQSRCSILMTAGKW